MGLEPSRWTPGAFQGWDFLQHIPRTLTSPSGPRKSPPASAQSSAAGWSTWTQGKKGFFSVQENPAIMQTPHWGCRATQMNFLGPKQPLRNVFPSWHPPQPHVLVLQLLHFPILLLLQLLDEAPEDGHLKFDVLSDLGGRRAAGNDEEGDELAPPPHPLLRFNQGSQNFAANPKKKKRCL